MKKKALKDILVIIIALWIFITNVIQAVKCPEMSQTELFLHIPKSTIMQWEKCE